MKTRHFLTVAEKLEILDFHEKNKESYVHDKRFRKFLERIIFYSKRRIFSRRQKEIFWNGNSNSGQFLILLDSLFIFSFQFSKLILFLEKKYSSSSQSRTVRWKGAITCGKRAITSDKIRIEKYALYFWKAEKNLHRMRFKKPAFEVLKKIGKITGQRAITGHAWVKSRCPVIPPPLYYNE